MVKVSAYLLGEYNHLLARRPGCSPKDIFVIIHEKLPTVSTPTISILLSTYAKILMHSQTPDPELQTRSGQYSANMKHALILRYNKELWSILH
uniref:Uncharacterized protein n=1 Tax=Lactuca sativa TaxID=4236 RepID=A0A9R1XJ90_LACSA|nr:hypothetical protein LSAT_V11C300137280 [Lactuca sativa]